MTLNTHKTPRNYSELGADGACPVGAAWSEYGHGDQVGSINLLTASSVLESVKLVRKGAVFSLNWSLDMPNPALFGRKHMQHTICFDEGGADDHYDSFFPQGSTQWDSLGHIIHPEHGFYQGFRHEDINGGPNSRLGIEHWANRGIVGRFALADIERYRRKIGRPLRANEADEVSVEEIEACLEAQGTAISSGTILLLRFGWINWYESSDETTRVRLAQSDDFPACGLARSENTARWIWERELAAIAGDNPALEVQPFDPGSKDGFLHYRLIPLLGMAIGEMFSLDALAEDCASDGCFEGMLVSAPLNKNGGVGSPANALAIK